jgi:Protein of unknown function (DUF3060)
MFTVKILRFLSSALWGCGIFFLLASCKSFDPFGGWDRDCCGGGKEPISNHQNHPNHEKATAKPNSKSKPDQSEKIEQPPIAVAPVVVVPELKVVDQNLPNLKEVEKMVPVTRAGEASIKEIPNLVEAKPRVAETVVPPPPAVPKPVAEAPKPSTVEPKPAVAAAVIASEDSDKKNPIKISEEKANRIIEAQGRDVVLTGSEGVFVITGGCGRLTLNGEKNQIQCDSVAQIEVVGDGNTLILGSVGGGRIQGSGNNLSWGRGVDGFSPIVESFGTNNSMKRLE